MRVVLAGAHGHGRWHLDNLRRLTAAGLVELVGVCDLVPVPAEDLDGLGDPAQDTDLVALVERTGAEVTILVTPIHTHVDLAVAALRAGSHLLLEKPPAASLAGYERIATAVRETGLACQVGFQSLGSAAVPALRDLIASGELGDLVGIGAAGAWPRPNDYFRRAVWSGHRRLGDVPVTDGALTNPFAHAVATALAVAGAEEETPDIEVELYRANEIEADDTSCVRLRLADGTPVTVAVTLCAPERHEPYLIVHGTRARATLTYTLDRLTVVRCDNDETGTDETGTDETTTHERTDLLENLVDHVRTGTPLLVPLASTRAFTHVLEAVRRAPDPRPIPESCQRIERDGRVVPGVVDATVSSAERLALYSELDLPWAQPVQPLHVDGRDVATYRWRVDLPATVSPRPHLHPVRTLGGVELSEAMPPDHAHHLGVGVAIADVDGSNFWGGRTYLPGRGPTWCADHGRQRHVRFERRDAGGFVEHLEWVGPDGRPVLGETRAVTAMPLDGSGWALDLTFTLQGTARISSSATKGRAGAGYGGFFWRAPGSALRRTVFTVDDEGEERVNGSRTPWVAMSGTAPGGRDWTLVFAQRGSADPWFVRVREYPGVGPALAWDRPLVLSGSLTRRVTTIVADGRLDRDTVAGIIDGITEMEASHGHT